VIAVRKAAKPGLPRVMLTAHMDEVGLIVVSATDDGLLRFRTIGGVDARVLVSKRVKVGYDAPDKPALPGVIGAMAIHSNAGDRKAVLPSTAVLDIGAKDKARPKNAPPERRSPSIHPIRTSARLRVRKPLDDRCVYNLLRLLDAPYEGELAFAFTSQEEVGCRGAAPAGYRVQPDIALILDATTANDLGETPEALQVCRVGGGVCVSFMDYTSIGDAELYRAMLAAAEKAGVPCQVKQFVAGGNDAGAVQRAGAGSRTLALSVPCRNIHSPASVCAVSDVDAQAALVRAWLATL
jgi:endoglucanase